MFVRKLYYDLITGEVLSSHMRQGCVRMTTFGEDVAFLPELMGRTEADTGCMAWTEPDPVIEDGFNTATTILVDVTQNPHQVVFDYTPVEEEPEPTVVMEEALNELGVITRE